MLNLNKPLDRSLLPDNSSLFEESFEHAAADMMASENHYSWLTDPMKTKVDLLDILAKEAGVVDWYKDDNVEMKRATVDGSYRFLMRAGTRSALRDALSAINVEVDFVDSPFPYTLDIEGFVSNAPITPELLDRTYKRISTYKSERDDIRLNLTRVNNATISIASSCQVSDYVFFGAAYE